MSMQGLPTLDAMRLTEVEPRAAALPAWERRGLLDWLWGRGRDWTKPEAEQELWRRVAERMRTRQALRVGDLGDEVAEDWHPRLAPMYSMRDR